MISALTNLETPGEGVAVDKFGTQIQKRVSKSQKVASPRHNIDEHALLMGHIVGVADPVYL